MQVESCQNHCLSVVFEWHLSLIDEIVSHLRVLCIDEGASLEDKIKEVKKFVYKYGSSSEVSC